MHTETTLTAHPPPTGTPSPQGTSQTLCWDPGCMFAVPLPCIREQLSHSQLLVPHLHQSSKAGTSLGSYCTYTLIIHAPHPQCLLSGVHTLLHAYSSCLVFAHTRHLLSTLFPAPPCPQIFLNTKVQLPLGSPA